jgi:hypothetical protein
MTNSNVVFEDQLEFVGFFRDIARSYVWNSIATFQSIRSGYASPFKLSLYAVLKPSFI